MNYNVSYTGTLSYKVTITAHELNTSTAQSERLSITAVFSHTYKAVRSLANNDNSNLIVWPSSTICWHQGFKNMRRCQRTLPNIALVFMFILCYSNFLTQKISVVAIISCCFVCNFSRKCEIVHSETTIFVQYMVYCPMLPMRLRYACSEALLQ